MREQKIIFKKIGNHWYPNIYHQKGYDISLSYDIERLFNLIQKHSFAIKDDILTIVLTEIGDIIESKNNIVYFAENDIQYYLYAVEKPESFDIRFDINDQEYYISNVIYEALENEFNLNFHKTLYKINIY